MTPHRTPCAQPEQLRIAPSFLQRSARDYCSALTLAASCQGVADCLLSPVLLTLVGNNWVALAATRGAMCVGALLPPRSRLRSLPRTLRRALLMRAALWAFLLPALLAVVGSDLFAPKLFLILGQRAGRTVVVSACLAAAMLVDGFLASIPAAAGGGLRLEFQLASGFEMRAPDRLLRRLRRRLLAASEAGTIGFAPLLALGAWSTQYSCGSRCEQAPWIAAFILPSLLAIAISLLSLVAALTLCSHKQLSPPNEFERASHVISSGLSFGLTDTRPNPDAARTSEVHTASLSTPECVASMASDTAAMQPGRASDSTQQCHPALEQPAESERAPSPFRTPTNPILSLGANARAAAREEGALSASVMLALLRACEECAICVFLPLACVHRTVQATPAAPLWGSLVCAAATAYDATPEKDTLPGKCVSC
ncbi:MAG: hypothetical protein SGPRY_000468, partial [Prymnesium sp.]